MKSQLLAFLIMAFVAWTAGEQEWKITAPETADVEKTDSGDLKVKVRNIAFEVPESSWRIIAVIESDDYKLTADDLLTGYSECSGSFTADFSRTPVPPGTYPIA